jgi:Flp pilus assembly protein TadB
MSLTQLFQHRETPDSEKVLRRMLQPDGEIWYWDPSSNVVDKRAAKRPKKDEKKEKRSEKKLEKQLRKEEKKRQKQERQAEYSNNRKALTTSGIYRLNSFYLFVLFIFFLFIMYFLYHVYVLCR